MKNKVLFILGDGVYPFKTGGMEVFNFYLIRELRQFFNISYLAGHKLEYDECMYHHIHTIRPAKFVFPLQILWHFLTHPSEKKTVISFSSAHWFIWWMYSLIIRLFRIKSIAVIHYGKTVPQEHPSAYKAFFHSQKTVVAVSDDIKRNYDNAFGTNCVVLPPLVPFEHSSLSTKECREKYGIPHNANVICMVGSIKGMKNPDTLIEAISKMTKEELSVYNPFALYAGNGAMLEELKEETEILEISDRVKFLGNVPKEEVKDVMKASDIYLIASDFEGTSVSMLEAMFNKMPILSSRAPGLKDMVREDIDALMFETRNAEQLKSLIIKASSHQGLTTKLSQSANTRYIEKYSYSAMINEYRDLLS